MLLHLLGKSKLLRTAKKRLSICLQLTVPDFSSATLLHIAHTRQSDAPKHYVPFLPWICESHAPLPWPAPASTSAHLAWTEMTKTFRPWLMVLEKWVNFLIFYFIPFMSVPRHWIYIITFKPYKCHVYLVSVLQMRNQSSEKWKYLSIFTPLSWWKRSDQ